MTGADDTPLVSIGMPVHNESAYIDAALTALRGQDYPRIEIIVCDNASTDATLAICTRHAAVDARIRIEVSNHNLGITENFRRAFELASGEYFMWASGHDTWAPDLVGECVALLRANPNACVAFASADWIGPDDEPIGKCLGWTDTRGLGPLARFFTILWGNMHPVLGVMRADQLRACGPMPAFVGGDLALLADLSLRGDFVHARNSGWSRRELRFEANHEQKVRRYVSSEFGLTGSWLSRSFPLLALPGALMKLLLRSRLDVLDKIVALTALLPLLLLRYRVGRRAGER